MAGSTNPARAWLLTPRHLTTRVPGSGCSAVPTGVGRQRLPAHSDWCTWLAEAGLDVQARLARVSPVEAIHTHFASDEQARLGMRRLDQQAEAAHGEGGAGPCRTGAQCRG